MAINLTVGQTSLLTEFLNYKLGVSGRIYQKDTEKHLQQFLNSYYQNYVDDKNDKLYEIDNDGNTTVNPAYTDYDVYDDGNYPHEDCGYQYSSNLFVYPNSQINIHTLPPLTDIEIELEDSNKIYSVQNALKWTKYDQEGLIEVTGSYNQPTINALEKFQRDKSIYQEVFPIIYHSNLVDNRKNAWVLKNEDGEEVTDINSSFKTAEQSISIYADKHYVFKLFQPAKYNEEDAPYAQIEFKNSDGIKINIEDVNEKLEEVTLEVEYIKKYGQDRTGNRIDNYVLSKLIAYEDILKNEQILLSNDLNKCSYLDIPSTYYSTLNYDLNNSEIVSSSLFIQNLYIKINMNQIDVQSLYQIEQLTVMLCEYELFTDIYEPKYQTENTLFYSGKLNIPTYNALKKEFLIREVL